MLGKEKNKYKAYVKLINKCLFHTLQKYTDDKISYNNMLKLVNNGARVLHNKCIEMARDNMLEIVVRSTFNKNK